MKLKRRKIKVSEKYGDFRNKEDAIKDSVRDSERSFKEMYKLLNTKEKKQISYDYGLEQARNKAKEVESTKSMDEIEITERGPKDKPKSISEFTRFIKENINNGLFVEYNKLIGDNVGGHSVYMIYNGEPAFVCGVGKNLDRVIKPETEIEKIYDPQKNDWERKIKSRGWLSAISSITNWLNKRNLPVKKRNFL